MLKLCGDLVVSPLKLFQNLALKMLCLPWSGKKEK